METSYKNRLLRINTDANHINKLEVFLEQICEDYKIYDAYYGNILHSNTIIFDICCEISNKKINIIDYVFKADAEGIFFIIKLYDMFLDIAQYYDQKEGNDINFAESDSYEIKLKMIKLLTDKIKINPEEGSIELIYFITGVNELLTNQRIEMLEKYYSSMTQSVKH